MKKISLLLIVLFMFSLVVMGCNTGIAPEINTPTSTPQQGGITLTPTPQTETKLKFWAEPEVVSYDSTQGTWSYTIHVTVEGNEDVTLTKLEVYEKITETSPFTYFNTYYQSQMQAWPYWKVHLSPGESIYFRAYFIHTPPYQRKFTLYGETQSGKTVTAEMIVTFLP